MANYGLSVLMESIKNSETSERQSDKLMFLFESTVSDRTASMVTGEDYDIPEDSVARDDAGYGIGHKEEQRLNQIIDNIPEDTDEDVEGDVDDIENVLECIFGV